MQVIIVGSGICGLTAGIALRRAGHKVRIFEHAPTCTAFGAGVVLGHNAMNVLLEYGIDCKAANMTYSKSIAVHSGSDMKVISWTTMDSPEYEARPGVKQFFAHRVDLQQELLRMATSEESSGTPVEMIYNSNVAAYDAEKGSITLTDGTTYSADLVVAADGVHSAAPRYLLGHKFDAKFTGTSIVRFMLRTEALKNDPALEGLTVADSQSSLYLSNDKMRYLLQYPIRNDTIQNFGMYTINKDVAEIDDQVYKFNADKESLRRELEGFHPSILALVPKAAEILPVWKLLEREPMPTWHRGRLVAIGDAVHPMLPNQGQGAGMAVEDSAALGVMFNDMQTTSEQEIEERLKLFEKVRKPRASVVQLVSSAPYYENGFNLRYEQCLEQMPKEQLPKSGDPKDMRPWLFKYDVLEKSQKVLNESLGGKQTGSTNSH